MKSQAQYTIYSLNDVYTSSAAPTNPYKGELWVDTSESPPITKVYDGSAWKEQNGTDTIKSNITTIQTKQSSFETNLNGLSSTVSVHTSEINGLGEKVSDLESDVSSLEQTASSISAEVSKKVNQTQGNASSSFGWKLLSDGFYIYSNADTVTKITSSGLEVKGKIAATSGSVAGFEILEDCLRSKEKKYWDSEENGIYISDTGIGFGPNAFYVTQAGFMFARRGKIGGFLLSDHHLVRGTPGKDESILLSTGSTDSYAIGGSEEMDGWVISAGSRFGVTKNGTLYANDVYLEGDIYATSGYFENCEISDSCTIYGYLYMSGSEEVKFYGSKTNMNYETWVGGSGIASQVKMTSSNVTHTSYAYNKPFGQILVPEKYNAFANDGMIFGIMETNSFKLQNLLAGFSVYFSNADSSYSKLESEFIARAGDKTFLDATYDSSGYKCVMGYSSGKNIFNGNWYFSEGNTNSYLGATYTGSTTFYYYGALYGSWYVVNNLLFGEASSQANGNLGSITQNNNKYAYLGGTWYAQELNFGSYSSYRIRVDGDQLTWFYNGTQLGELESYSSGYVDVQGTWKTNGNNWISSSDRRIKKEIVDLDESYDVIFDNLRPRNYKYINGNKGRIHSGFIAQEVTEAIESAGKSLDDVAYVCAFEDKDGNITYGLRYEELIALNTYEIQKLKRRIKELEDKLL